MSPMLVRPVIIPFFFATYPAFCSISESPLRGCGVEMKKRIEQKTAKAAKGEGVTEIQCVVEFASDG